MKKSWLLFGLANCVFLLTPVQAIAQDDICYAGKALPLDFEFNASVPGDFDGDGDIDVALTPFASSGSTSQAVIALNDGAGNFTLGGSFGNSNEDKNHVAAFDVDGDSDLDLIITNDQNSGQLSRLVILRNNGDATFATQTFINGLPKIQFMGHRDLDGDADVDLVVISLEDITVLGNPGDGNFATASNDSYDGARFDQVVFEDFDNDQTVDFAVSERVAGEVWIFSNMGGLTFSDATAISTGSGVGSLVPIDFDGDQDVDIAVEAAGNNLAILENNGDQTFSIGVPFPRFAAYDAIMFAEDFDFDNDLDIFDGISWHVNDGGVFQSRVDLITDIITVAILADVDNDGDSDVFFRPFNTAGHTSLATLLNNGDGTYGTIKEYSQNNDSSFLMTVDLNGDSLPDVLNLDRQNDLLWYQLNTGNNSFGPEVVVNVGTSPSGVAAGDIDDDGDVDLVVANNNSNDVSVILQDANGQFNVSVGLPAGDDPERVALNDLDGDGDVDLLVSTHVTKAAVGICINDSGSFGPMQIIEEVEQFRAREIVVADFDGDEDLDFVLSHSSNSVIEYDLFVNDGSAAFSSVPIMTGLTTSGKLYVADIDGDQNQDLVQARVSGGVFQVQLGNGDGTFQSPVDIGEDILARGSAVCDIDGDQDIDLIARAQGSVLIYENNNGAFGAPLWFALSDDGQLACADFDGDSKIDLLGQNRFNFSISYHCPDVITSVVFGPTTATVEQGTLRSGSVDDLLLSDNVDMTIFRNRVSVSPRIEIVVAGSSSIANPSSIEFTFESSVFARRDVEQTIELFNYSSDSWDQVDVRPASRFVDSTTTITIDSNAADYVQPGTGAVEARISHNSSIARLSYSVNADHAQWVTNQ